MTKFQTFIKYLPKFCHYIIWAILFCCKCNINKINCYDTFIKSAIEFIISVFVFPRRKKRAASHTSKAKTLFKFFHYLFTYIIWNKSLSGALCCKFRKIPIRRILMDIIFFKDINKFWESGRNPNTYFILNSLIALFKYFLDNKCKVMLCLLILHFVKIHKNSYKW